MLDSSCPRGGKPARGASPGPLAPAPQLPGGNPAVSLLHRPAGSSSRAPEGPWGQAWGPGRGLQRCREAERPRAARMLSPGPPSFQARRRLLPSTHQTRVRASPPASRAPAERRSRQFSPPPALPLRPASARRLHPERRLGERAPRHPSGSLGLAASDRAPPSPRESFLERPGGGASRAGSVVVAFRVPLRRAPSSRRRILGWPAPTTQVLAPRVPAAVSATVTPK